MASEIFRAEKGHPPGRGGGSGPKSQSVTFKKTSQSPPPPQEGGMALTKTCHGPCPACKGDPKGTREERPAAAFPPAFFRLKALRWLTHRVCPVAMPYTCCSPGQPWVCGPACCEPCVSAVQGGTCEACSHLPSPASRSQPLPTLIVPQPLGWSSWQVGARANKVSSRAAPVRHQHH